MMIVASSICAPHFANIHIFEKLNSFLEPHFRIISKNNALIHAIGNYKTVLRH